MENPREENGNVGKSLHFPSRHVEFYAHIFVTWKGQRKKRKILASGWKRKLGKEKLELNDIN